MTAADATADVVIVGAGASGAAVAWSLAKAGIQVVCLEQGGWIQADDYAHGKDDWELHRQTDFSPEPNERRRPEDYPLNVEETPILPLMFNAVGGSTIHWSGHFPRFRPSDFRVKTLDGVAADWPLTYWDLEPFYEQNDAAIGVMGLAGDPANPPRRPRSSPPPGLDVAGEAYARGFAKLGWHWWPSDGALITAPFGDGRKVCNGCGPCDMGCPRGAMSSAQATYWPLALKAGARLITHARVREITVNGQGLASGALYYDRDGQIHLQRARAVVVAGNGVGTPRLLLNSASGLFPDGLANSSGLVGKNLMFHPVAFVTGVFDERVDGFKGPIGVFLHCQEFYETDVDRGFVRGLQLQLVRDSGALTTANGGFTRTGVPWGKAHHAALRERFAHSLTVGVMVEDLPETQNAVTLDPQLTDSHGIPAPKIKYSLSSNSRKALDFGVARSRELLDAAGALSLTVDPFGRKTGWHLMGTARMGDRPDDSVVDRWGRSHDVPNLFIVDGSLFVTCAAINPTSTIQALALRTADWIGSNRRDIPHGA